MYAQKGIRPCTDCGRKFNYRGGYRLCPQCKQKYKKAGLSLSGMPLASSRRHQCGKCLGKNLVTEPGMLCKDCFPTEVKSELKYTGTSAIGFIGNLLLLPCIFVAPVGIILLIKGVASADAVIFFGLLFFFGILAIKYSLNKEDEARADVFKKAEAAHASEISRIESLIGFASHDGANSKKSGEYFVYLHYFPDLNQVVYVGKGKNSRDQEEIRTNSEHTDLLRRGKLKVHRVLTRVSERVALEQESFLIGLFGRKSDGGGLFNVQGGDRQPKNHLPSLKKRNVPSVERSRVREFNSLDESLEEYSREMRRNNLSKEHRRRKKQQIRSASKGIGWVQVVDISSGALEDWLDGKGVSEKTKGNYRSSFSTYCSWLCENHKLKSNPFSRR